MALVEEGHCDPLECSPGSTFITKDYRIDCNSVPVTIPVNNVPIKQLLKGSLIAPWVRLQFDGTTPGVSCSKTDWSDTVITTGNISQPGNEDKCRAVIKSFQYGWGAQQSGNVCKIQIVDEKGSEFENWVQRLIRNPQGGSGNTCQGVYKMKVQWGWTIAGGDGNDCPADIPSVTPLPVCNAPPLYYSNKPYPYSSKPTQLLCSPPLWFLPDEINCSYQNNKFIFEITGKDPMFRAAEQPMAQTYGEEAISRTDTTEGREAKKIHFVDAVRMLSYDATPKFNVSFLQLPERPTGSTANPEPLEFHVPSNVGNVRHYHQKLVPNPSTNCTFEESPYDPPKGDMITDLGKLGPLDVWKCHNLSPIGVINAWLNRGVLGKSTENNGQGRGITINYDSIFMADSTLEYPGGDKIDPTFRQCGWPARGRLILWSNAIPICMKEDTPFHDRLKALYIVNGGQCSAVLSFNPSIKWNFNVAVRAAGVMGPTTATPVGAAVNTVATNCVLPGTGPRMEATVPTGMAAEGGAAPERVAVTAAQHLRANLLRNGIEAELRVQGDPSPWLCSPIEGLGRTVAIVVINPYFLDRPGEDENECPGWSMLSSSRCNNVLTNRNWFIKAVEHQIKEGSYVTTIKATLLPFMSEIQAGSPLVHMGGDPLHAAETWSCQQATLSCKEQIISPRDVTEGTQTFCDQPCVGDFEIT